MINTILTQINSVLAVIRENLFVSLLVVVVSVHLFNRNKKFLLSLVTPKTRQYVTYSELSDERSTTTTTRATSNQSEALRRVRELQQGQTDEMAKVAAQERKKKAEEERKRKNLVAKRRDEWKENGGSGEADHDTDYSFSRSRNSSFNPMQPWSSGTGAGYRPQRRSVNRG